mmetsp:Transcript_61601/g.144410  ORF Transcript_61601/g.144410 Transcript_61601/m.144410 type:complete len:260 (-) Transcript_61601:823-1602(-)
MQRPSGMQTLLGLRAVLAVLKPKESEPSPSDTSSMGVHVSRRISITGDGLVRILTLERQMHVRHVIGHLRHVDVMHEASLFDLLATAHAAHACIPGTSDILLPGAPLLSVFQAHPNSREHHAQNQHHKNEDQVADPPRPSLLFCDYVRAGDANTWHNQFHLSWGGHGRGQRRHVPHAVVLEHFTCYHIRRRFAVLSDRPEWPRCRQRISNSAFCWHLQITTVGFRVLPVLAQKKRAALELAVLGTFLPSVEDGASETSV